MELLYMGFYYVWDPTYILVIIGLLLTLGASGLVNATYAKYKKQYCMSGLTGTKAERTLIGAYSFAC